MPLQTPCILEKMEEAIIQKGRHSEALRGLETRVSRFAKKIKLRESVSGESVILWFSEQSKSEWMDGWKDGQTTGQKDLCVCF